jgi:hypothetical protein
MPKLLSVNLGFPRGIEWQARRSALEFASFLCPTASKVF